MKKGIRIYIWTNACFSLNNRVNATCYPPVDALIHLSLVGNLEAKVRSLREEQRSCTRTVGQQERPVSLSHTDAEATPCSTRAAWPGRTPPSRREPAHRRAALPPRQRDRRFVTRQRNRAGRDLTPRGDGLSLRRCGYWTCPEGFFPICHNKISLIALTVGAPMTTTCHLITTNLTLKCSIGG